MGAASDGEIARSGITVAPVRQLVMGTPHSPALDAPIRPGRIWYPLHLPQNSLACAEYSSILIDADRRRS